jgi:hypothetical protein
MPQKFRVRSALQNGQPFYGRAGRGWTDQWAEITVLDQDDDPMVPNKVKNLPDVPDPSQVGRRSFAKLSADKRIIVKPLDGADADAINRPALEARVSELEKALDKAHTALCDLTARCDGRRGDARPGWLDGWLAGWQRGLLACPPVCPCVCLPAYLPPSPASYPRNSDLFRPSQQLRPPHLANFLANNLMRYSNQRSNKRYLGI